MSNGIADRCSFHELLAKSTRLDSDEAGLRRDADEKTETFLAPKILRKLFWQIHDESWLQSHDMKNLM